MPCRNGLSMKEGRRKASPQVTSAVDNRRRGVVEVVSVEKPLGIFLVWRLCIGECVCIMSGTGDLVNPAKLISSIRMVVMETRTSVYRWSVMLLQRSCRRWVLGRRNGSTIQKSGLQ